MHITILKSRLPSFKYLFLISLLMFCSLEALHAQVKESSNLFKKLARIDSLLFEESFNQCKLGILDKLIANELQFYHDVSGKQNRKEFYKAVRDNICSDSNHKPIRRLVSGSLRVYPLKNNGILYGAIQKGTHEFYLKEPEKDLYLTSIADFTHVWVLQNDNWKLQTVLSYNHRVPPPH